MVTIIIAIIPEGSPSLRQQLPVVPCLGVGPHETDLLLCWHSVSMLPLFLSCLCRHYTDKHIHVYMHIHGKNKFLKTINMRVGWFGRGWKKRIWEVLGEEMEGESNYILIKNVWKGHLCLLPQPAKYSMGNTSGTLVYSSQSCLHQNQPPSFHQSLSYLPPTTSHIEPLHPARHPASFPRSIPWVSLTSQHIFWTHQI